MENCIFCRIAGGAQPAEKIYEDKEICAFLDINPVNIGHALIVPKKHIRNILDADDKTLAKMFQAAKKVAVAVKEATKADGVNVSMNNELAAGQLIYHAHIHVIPRYKNDGFIMWCGNRGYDEGEIEKTGEAIRRVLNK